LIARPPPDGGRQVAMRIAIDCRPAIARMSGVGRYVINLAEALSEIPGLELLFLAGHNVHERLRGLQHSQLVPLDDIALSTQYEQRLKWEQRALPSLLKKLKPDIYHATWNYGVPATSRVRAVLTVHDLFPLYTAGEFGSRRSRLSFLVSQHIALIRARRIIAVSNATKTEISRHAPWANARVRTIPEAADSIFAPASGGSERSYLLYVGGFEPRKNIGTLLSAYGIAMTKFGITLPLRLLGDASRLDASARAIFESLQPSVRESIEFLTCDDASLPFLYSGAAVFVFPSRFEGFGLPPLEAIACGTPVITTRCGAIPEAVGGHACFVDPDNPTEFAQAIVRLLNDQEYRAALVAGGVEYAATMNWRRVADNTVNIYYEVMGTPSRVPGHTE
jgi:glycosyltransferase involved in cell wall biosynthesis